MRLDIDQWEAEATTIINNLKTVPHTHSRIDFQWLDQQRILALIAALREAEVEISNLRKRLTRDRKGENQ